MIAVNSHELCGIVLKKSGPYSIGSNSMNKSYLYVTAPYMYRGNPKEQVVKCVCFSWADTPSKIAKVFPGDQVKFTFSIAGRMEEGKVDRLGAPSVWNEIIIESKVEILNTSQRQLYQNEPTESKELPEAEFKYTDGESHIGEKDEEVPF